MQTASESGTVEEYEFEGVGEGGTWGIGQQTAEVRTFGRQPIGMAAQASVETSV